MSHRSMSQAPALSRRTPGEQTVDHTMSEPRDDVTEIWLEHRPYLVDVAFRMLGNIHDAEDVVQDAFGRLVRHGIDGIDDVRGWLVVVVSRLCLDHLRSAHTRRE